MRMLKRRCDGDGGGAHGNGDGVCTDQRAREVTDIAPRRRRSQPDPSSSDLRPGDDHVHGRHRPVVRPTGEVLPAKRWSGSGYRVNFDHQQGFSDVSNWPVTFGFGVSDRAEIFGAWTVIRRIDRDIASDLPPGSKGGRFGQRLPVRASGLVRQSARRLLGWRQGQPDVRVEAEADGSRHPRHDEAADGEE